MKILFCHDLNGIVQDVYEQLKNLEGHDIRVMKSRSLSDGAELTEMIGWADVVLIFPEYGGDSIVNFESLARNLEKPILSVPKRPFYLIVSVINKKLERLKQ